MKAARIYGPGDIRVEQVPDPVINDDEILVKVHACGICGTDVHYYHTGDTSKNEKPLIPGHEFSGEIADIGINVKGLTIGDRVIGTGLRDCGKCYWCKNHLEFCPNPAVPGEGLDGAFAEYVVVPNPMLGSLFFRIPYDLSWEKAATVEPMAVSCFAVEQAQLRDRETVVVMGAGAIGLGILQACRTKGARQVIVSEPSALRRETALKLGADTVFDPLESDPFEAVARATSGKLATTVFECSGSPNALGKAGEMIRPFGKIMQVGIYERNTELTPEQAKLMFQFRNATIRGSGGQQWEKALDLMESGLIHTDDLITHTFPLDDIRQAFEIQSDPEQAIKVVILLQAS